MSTGNMEPTDRGRQILDTQIGRIRTGEVQPEADLVARVASAMDTHDVSRSYALITQPLCKLLAPAVDTRSLDSGRWPGFSPRVLSKAVVVPWNSSVGRPLPHSEDPYVSNPLRGGTLGDEQWRSGRRPSDIADWMPTLDLLDEVEAAADPEVAADRLLGAVLAHLASLALSPSTLLEQTLELQHQIDGAEQDERTTLHSARAELLTQRGTRMLEGWAHDHSVELSIEASTGFGSPSAVPWVRLFDPEQSPAPTDGEYLAYLFAADGSAVFLALEVGTESRSLEAVDRRVMDLRRLLGPQNGLIENIDLRSKRLAGRPRTYEHGTVLAFSYERGRVPSDDQLLDDVRQLEQLLTAIRASTPDRSDGVLHRLTPEAVREALGDLIISESLLIDAVAALRAGKHLLLTGPPGTGKTTFGQALAEAAQRVGICDGWTTTTATAAWTAYDTVGGYQQQLDTTLEFRPGVALRSIDANRWLVLDELNRADIDKALGPLFTVLSGQAVELTLEESLDGAQLPVAIVPAGVDPPDGTSPHPVPAGWRIIATMNTWDQDLLFSMSFALIRRFAVLHVDPPPAKEVSALLGEAEPLDDPQLAAAVAQLASIPHAQLGPAVIRAAARFVRERQLLAPPIEERDDWLKSAIASEVIPQLAHLHAAELAQVAGFLADNVLKGTARSDVKTYLEKHLGHSIADPPSSGEAPPERSGA